MVEHITSLGDVKIGFIYTTHGNKTGVQGAQYGLAQNCNRAKTLILHSNI